MKVIQWIKKAIIISADDAYNRQDWSVAKTHYLSLFQGESGNKKVLLLKLADIAEKESDHSAAREYYSELISQYKAKAVWYFRLAENERWLKMWKDAVSSYKSALHKVPNHLMSLYGRSKCYSAQGQFEEAHSCIEKVLGSKAKATYWADKAFYCMRLKQWNDGIEAFQQAIDMAADRAKSIWLARQAECYNKLHDTDNAIRCYRTALEKTPEKPAWQGALAVLYAKTGQTALAIEAYQQAVALDNTHADWFAELGRLLADTDKQAAVAAYSRAVELGRKALSYEIAVLSCDGLSLQHVEPEALFTARRFDLCVKLLYARELLGLPGCNSEIHPTQLYLRHIHLRTKGNEPDNKTKTSLADYQQSFAQLLTSIQQHGFDESHAIPLAQDGGLLNGAHRGAAAAALQLPQVPVVFIDKPQGIGWDFNWFMQCGFNLDELNELFLCWLENTPERGHIIILWPAVVEHWDTITADIASELELVTQRDINFTALGFSELIKDIYSTDKVAEFMPNILAKVDKLAACPPQLRVLVVYGDSRRVNAIKAKVRQQYDAIVPEQSFCTLHASADHAEALHLGHILFHQPTLALLQNRTRPLSAHLSAWIAEAKQALVNRNASIQDGCVVGGAVLDAYEVRQADDLDMTVSLAVRQAHFSDKACPLTDHVDIVNKDYARSVSGVICDDDLLTDRALHLYVRGFKFACLDVVRQRKAYSQREKDLVDLAKISRHFWQPEHG